MRIFLTLALSLLVSSCTHAQSSHQVNKLSVQSILPNCKAINESFQKLNNDWTISKLVNTPSFMQSDINNDNKKDFLAIFQPSDTLLENCQSSAKNPFTLFIDINNKVPITTHLGIGYASLPELHKLNNGFSLTYETGQSIKCSNTAKLTVKQQNVYLSEIQTMCYVPNSNIDLQKKTFEANHNNLIGKVNLPALFENLQIDFFDTSRKTFIVANKKAIIYNSTDSLDKTNAYFIKGDVINPIDIDGSWVYVGYKNNTKFGWLMMSDLIENK